MVAICRISARIRTLAFPSLQPCAWLQMHNPRKACAGCCTAPYITQYIHWWSKDTKINYLMALYVIIPLSKFLLIGWHRGGCVLHLIFYAISMSKATRAQNQCWMVLKMRYSFSLVINSSIYISTYLSIFKIFKESIWYITMVLKNMKKSKN